MSVLHNTELANKQRQKSETDTRSRHDICQNNSVTRVFEAKLLWRKTRNLRHSIFVKKCWRGAEMVFNQFKALIFYTLVYFSICTEKKLHRNSNKKCLHVHHQCINLRSKCGNCSVKAKISIVFEEKNYDVRENFQWPVVATVATYITSEE